MPFGLVNGVGQGMSVLDGVHMPQREVVREEEVLRGFDISLLA